MDGFHDLLTFHVLKLGLKPLILGGEHSISSGAIESIFKRHSDIIILQLDAHADLRQDWQGTKHSHACAMRRCLEVLPSKNLFQVGIRSGTAKEFAELKQYNRLIPFTSGAKTDCIENALNPFKSGNWRYSYLSSYF